MPPPDKPTPYQPAWTMTLVCLVEPASGRIMYQATIGPFTTLATSIGEALLNLSFLFPGLKGATIITDRN